MHTHILAHTHKHTHITHTYTHTDTCTSVMTSVVAGPGPGGWSALDLKRRLRTIHTATAATTPRMMSVQPTCTRRLGRGTQAIEIPATATSMAFGSSIHTCCGAALLVER